MLGVQEGAGCTQHPTLGFRAQATMRAPSMIVSQIKGTRAATASSLRPGQHHVLGVQEVQAARDVQGNAAAALPPAERVRLAAAARAAVQRAEQVAALQASWTDGCILSTVTVAECPPAS